MDCVTLHHWSKVNDLNLIKLQTTVTLFPYFFDHLFFTYFDQIDLAYYLFAYCVLMLLFLTYPCFSALFPIKQVKTTFTDVL